ncbi:hypothetical protein [Burkholderia anthina]|uniref:hypothetical protein n=1 Tax=Burkholderia anthina TaxID=179879 RepID=UPI001FC8E2F5|nr:hypothetical protein [Burkholderia anthina]
MTIAPTIYFNVPKGWEELTAALERDAELCDTFFSRVKLYFFGGAGPLLVWCMPESRAYLDVAGTQGAPTSVARTLFGDGRTTSTVALWVSYVRTLIVLYFLLNWLPSLMARAGSTASMSNSCSSRSTSARIAA